MKCVTTRNKRITSDFESSKARILPSWQAWYQVDVERFKLKSAWASSTDIPPTPKIFSKCIACSNAETLAYQE
jgi:hypothetical protein